MGRTILGAALALVGILILGLLNSPVENTTFGTLQGHICVLNGEMCAIANTYISVGKAIGALALLAGMYLVLEG